jgi:nucleoside-diphosphate-sugar epimerase
MAFYLVTGGAGFIGSNIVHELLKRGDRVRIIENFSTGKRENLADVLDRIELLEGDLRNIGDVREAVAGIDYVLHQAALPSVPRSIRDPVASNESNVSGTVNLLTAAKDASVKRLVFASSSSVYGDTPTLPKTEDMPPNPRSPYAVSKSAGEYYCRVFFEIYGLETVILRYFNIFGPRQDPASPYSAVIPLFIAKIAKGEKPVIFGDGTQSRDFTFVENAVRANLLAAGAPDAPGKTFNIAGGKRHSLNELVEKLNKIMGTALDPSHAETRRGDVKHSLAEISLAKRHLGYEPLVDFEEGLRKTVAWYRIRA